MNCDRVVFPGDYPALPYGAPIISFTQRWAGQQTLPTQVRFNFSCQYLGIFKKGRTDRSI